MKQLIALTLLSVFGLSEAINRPVYKILLAQKGFAQFLQYDVEIPPLREFTFCTWLRLYHFSRDQTIFTYVVKGDNRVIRLWLEQGGTRVRLSVSGRVATGVPVSIAKDVWTHLCLSYQSDYGAWALYIDGHLVACEVSQSLYGYVLPRDGSVLIGYGTDENGESNGIEGEIFGANMILMSTIEKNISSQMEPQYEMTLFPKNKVKINEKIKYTVLSDLSADDIRSKRKNTVMAIRPTKSLNDIFKPLSTISDHDIGFDSFPKPKFSNNEILEFSEGTSKFREKTKIPLWALVNKTGQEGHFKKDELSSSGTQDLPAISLIETPPPVGQSNETFHLHDLEFDKPPTDTSVYNMFATIDSNPTPPEESKGPIDMEIPPPPQTNPSVYGQWSSSNFAGTVLNYLKNINFNNKPQLKKIPPTIPLTKISDSLPYATELKITKNPIKLSITDKHYGYTPLIFRRTSFTDKAMVKRAKRDKQINVEILEDDLRESILKMHAQTKPINVEVTNRGENNASTQRYYRNTNDRHTKVSDDVFTKPRPFKVTSDLKNHRLNFEGTSNEGQVSLMTTLPFLKSVEYFTGSAETTDFHAPDEKQDMYTRTLRKGNKWHNTKSYNDDYTPRQIDIETDSIKSSMAENFADANQQHQTIRVKYEAKEYKTVPISEDDNYKEQGRRIAQRVSGKSDISKGISTLQYNHGFLPGHKDLRKTTGGPRSPLVSKRKLKKPVVAVNSFDKPIKIGNALNEGHVLGFNDENTRKSFVGGDEKVPDINKHRSEFNTGITVPPSLHAQVCKSMEDLYHVILYVKPDGSIDNSHITSPIKVTNQAVEFILVNYQKCSIEDTKFEENPLLLINWSKTPVRLFGGAYPQKTKDLCGFF